MKRTQKQSSNFYGLEWCYESDGTWVAAARLTADGVPLFWRVRIEKTGLFSIGKSDSELFPQSRQFATHLEAVTYCELCERIREQHDAAEDKGLGK